MTPAPLFRRVVIAGVGLIGGSLGLALRERRLAAEVVGFGRGRANLEVALERGAIDRYEREPERAAERADLLVLAAPVRAFAGAARALVPHLAEDAVVTDAGSVKASVVAEIEPLVPEPRVFVGAHPIAGTERSGAAAAFASLFEGERCIVTPTERTPASAVARVRTLWEGVGMRVEVLSPTAHDRLLALVSHLPHVVAWALVGAIESARVDGRDPLPYSGGGLRDTTRIASSHPEMWRDILLENRDQCLRAIDGFSAALATLRRLVEAGDGRALERELERLRTARGRIPRASREKAER